MKVILLNQSDRVGGAAVACGRLLQALIRHDVAAQMLVAERTFAGDPSILYYPVSPWRYKWGWMTERIGFMRHEKNKALRFAISTGSVGLPLHTHPAVLSADIIHLHWINKGFLSIKELGRINRLGQPVVWTLHDMWAFTGGCHYSGACRRFEQACGQCEQYLNRPAPNDLTHTGWLNKKASYEGLNLHIVTCSAWLAEEARKSSLFKNRPVTVIPNPIDTDVFKPSKDNRAHDKTTILFQAMNLMDKRKGFAYLIEALEILKHKYPALDQSVRVVLFGRCDFKYDLPFQTEWLGSLHHTDAIVRAYQRADLFVIPSLEENLPNTVMEAMACGLPVVGFNTGGVPEMIEHQRTGYVARKADAHDLAAGIYHVLSDAQRRAQYGQLARQKVLEKYAEPVVARQYKRLYLDILPHWA